MGSPTQAFEQPTDGPHRASQSAQPEVIPTAWAWLWTLPPLLAGSSILSLLVLFGLNFKLWNTYNWVLEIPMWPVFADLRVVLEGIRLHTLGIDPLLVGKPEYDFDYNYPRLWLQLGHIGVHRLSLAWTGFALGITWLTLLLGVARVRSFGLSVILVLALFAPPVSLALERGNIDLLLCIVCMLAAYAWQRPDAPWLAPGLIALGTLLKLFPGAAFAVILIDFKNRTRRIWWLAGAVAASVFWLMHLPELGLIASRTPRVTGASIGCAVVPMRFAPHLEGLINVTLSPGVILVGSLLLCIVWFALAAWLGLKLAPAFSRLNAPKVEVASYLFMSAISAGTFALGNSFSYRLIFVLPCLPFLWRVCTTAGLPLALWQWSAFTLGAALMIFYSPLNAHGRNFVIAQASSWLLAGALVTGFCALAKNTWTLDSSGGKHRT